MDERPVKGEGEVRRESNREEIGDGGEQKGNGKRNRTETEKYVKCKKKKLRKINKNISLEKICEKDIKKHKQRVK